MKNQRLFTYFQPNHYDLKLDIERQKRTFRGTVTIKGDLVQDANEIILNAHKLEIQNARIDDSRVSVRLTDNDELHLELAGMTAGTHEVTVGFSGTISDPMHGLYPCYFKLDGQDEELLATQFESHHAREVFPCIDEPEAKATFNLTLTTETGVTALSNTPIQNQVVQDGQLVTLFEKTPVMSTYLLAFVVGKLAYQETTTKDGVKVRTYATPDKKDQLRYALDTAVASLEFYNDYFDLPYPLPKCDLVALPDFSSGAMENWGCITFREAGLLVNEQTATSTKQYIVMVVAHELAHQWFGNLVTMKWWNDLWLNESFANWIEYLAVDHLHPEWEMWTQYYDDETSYAMNRDSLASVQKIQQQVHTPAEIQSLFDPAIVYAKGGSLLNMLHAYLGTDAYREGLRIYLKRHQYKNTEANDLWKALGEASGKDVLGFMQPWISQAGLPVVTVGNSNRSAELHQRRFYRNPKEANGNDQTVWPIPLLAEGQLDNELLKVRTAVVDLKSSTTPLLLNQGRTGYYLSLYSTEHTDQLASQVRDGKMPVIDRLGLLTDALNLNKAGLSPQLASLKLLDAYRNETSQPVWGAITDHIGALKMFADDDDEQLAKLRGFIQELARDQFERLGWEPIKGEPYFDELLRPLIIAHMAYSEDELVVTKLRDLFANATQPSDIWADIRSTVFSVAAKFEGEPALTKLLDWYEAASAQDRMQIVAGISGLRQPKLIKRALGLVTTDAVKLQDIVYWIIYLARSRYGRPEVWVWIKDNWPWIVEQFGNDMHYSDFPKYIASTFSRVDQLDDYKKFFEPKLNVPELSRTIRQGIEDIESRVLWRERDGESIKEYLLSL